MRHMKASFMFVALVAIMPVAAQQDWTPPKTPDGQPDI
jgi:hypothetical protein